MASTSATTAVDSSNVTATRRWSYDVFLSFRGEDTRDTFTAHLLASLHRKGIHTFIDNERLERGEKIAPALLKAIEGSRIAVVVFSENYASSTWCLDELSKIVECTESRGQTLIPIFYKVEPSVVRKQESGSFRTALQDHEQKFSDTPHKVQKWREALFKASNLAGEHFDNGNEEHFVEKIARLVSDRTGRQLLLHIADNPVGLDSDIEKVTPLLRIGSPDVVFIGILGIGGIGKTTLARGIYNLLYEGYEGYSFLANIRETSEQKNGLVLLQKQLLSDTLGGLMIDVSDVNRGITLIKDRLQNKKSLIVLDDVDNWSQIKAVAGGCDWFGQGSRIIITTRDEHLLVQVGASIHRMEGLTGDRARELLCLSAFREPSPPTHYAKVFSDVLNYAKGLPLALTVLGSFLYGRDVSQWEYTIQRLKDIPNKDIFNVLKLSYDGLDEDVKAIFLRIVCFFKWKHKDEAVKILNGCGYHSEIGIRVLTERSLISIIQGGFRDQKLDMHDLIEEMGRSIIRQEKNMFLSFEEIRTALEDNTCTGTDGIQAIYLDRRPPPDRMRLNHKAFEKMSRLQMLVLRGCDFSCGPSNLPNELRWLEWDYYHSSSLPPDFNPRNLIGLKLSGSRITKLWDGHRVCLNLSVIDLCGSKSFSEFPDVSRMPNLKELRADGCKSLVKVHESVGSLEKLEVLSFLTCSKLRKLPRELRLRSLLYLNLGKCSKLEKFPDIWGRMEHLETVDLSYTSIMEFPPIYENLTGLQTLNLTRTYIKALPRYIYHLPQLKELRLDDCKMLHGFLEKEEGLEEENIESGSPLGRDGDSSYLSIAAAVSFSFSSSSFPNLVHLHMSGSNITALSPCISTCYNLKELDLSLSKRLKEIPELPPGLKFLNAQGCISLETVGSESLRAMGKIRINFSFCQKLCRKEELVSKMLSEWLKGHDKRMRTSFHEEGYGEDYPFQVLVPEGDIPERFYHGQSSNGKNRLRFRVHSKVLKELVGFALSAAFLKCESMDTCWWLLDINGNVTYALKGKNSESAHVWVVYLHLKKFMKEEMLLADGWNHFSFEVWRSEKRLKSSGVSFISRTGEDINSSTEIEFLGPEKVSNRRGTHIDKDIGEVTTEKKDTDEVIEAAMADNEDTVLAASVNSGRQTGACCSLGLVSKALLR